MKSYYLILTILILSIAVGCGDFDECKIDIIETFDDKVLEYFESYEPNQKLVFISKLITDTVTVTSVAMKGIKIDCDSIPSKEIIMLSKFIFSKNQANIEIQSGNNVNIIDLSDLNGVSQLSIRFDRKEQEFTKKSNIELIDSISLNGFLFKKIIKVRDFDEQKTYFFAPKFGLIRCINSSDTFTIKM